MESWRFTGGTCSNSGWRTRVSGGAREGVLRRTRPALLIQAGYVPVEFLASVLAWLAIERRLNRGFTFLKTPEELNDQPLPLKKR